ncbi:hypothetical protein POM88_016956 [Heracleum sosnowskyi]|uniref:Uncharacterized protein n=1 Tax=Heracleum sosnowskyi TaxID=360622 RepID=A0AAD8IPF5_9APIA|nr:hypothetical protein POM88_016956 [Heracleum sosnowskyi]
MERFSIREYTCQMRSVDVLKCWPFGPTKIEYIEAFLPTITVKKFKWWTDELDNELTEDLTCPVCFVFKAVSTQELNGHVGKCIVQLAKKENNEMKAKSRGPKKRSIVELFAVAPQVEKVYEDEDVDEDDDDLSNQDDHVKLSAFVQTRLNDKRKRKMKLRDVTLANVSMNLKKKRKNGLKKAREIEAGDISINHKDKLLASKQKCTLNSTRNITSSSHTLGYAKDLVYAISDQKKNQNLKCCSAGKRTKAAGPAKSTLGKQKSVYSFPGILKKHSKVDSGKKSTIDTFLDSSEANWCSINQSNRHVRFSSKDVILGRRMKSVPHDVASLEPNHSAEERDRCVPVNVNRSESTSSINRGDENDVSSFTEKQISDTCLCVEKLNFPRPHVVQEQLLHRPVSSNQVAYCSENLQWLDHGRKVASPDSSSAHPPEFFSMRKMAYKPSLTTPGGENMSVSSTSKAKMISQYRDGPRFNGTCFKDFVTPSPQASSSPHVDKGNWNGYGGVQILPESASEKYPGQILKYHPIPHLSPKELMRSICSPPEMEQRGLMHLGRPKNEDYIGLPLNSHGEYIQLQSSGKGGFNQMMRPAIFTDSSRTMAFCSELPSNQEDHILFSNYDDGPPPEKQCNFLSAKGQAKDNSNFMESFRLGTTSRNDASLDFLRESCHSIYPQKSGIELMNIPSQSNLNDQRWNHTNVTNVHRERHSDIVLGNGTQPTMRLMGKEFSIGKNYSNLHEGKNVWMDNQIMVHHDGDIISNESSRRHFQPDLMMRPGTGKNKKIASSSEIQINMLSQSVFQIVPPDSRFTSVAVGCQTNAVYENACRAFGGVPIPQPYPYYPPENSPAIFSKGSSSHEPFVCERESLPVNQQPVRASSSHNSYQNLSSNFVENCRKVSQPFSPSSAFKFPFLYNDLGEHAQPYNCQSSLKSMTPSLINTTQVNETMIGSFQIYSDAADSHQPRMSSNNFPKTRPVCCKTDASYMHNPLTIQSPLQNGLDLASVARPPPVRPRLLPTSTTNNKREYRLKFKERMKARVCVKDPHNKLTKKKLKSVYSSKPANLSTREILSGGDTTLKAIGDTEIDALERNETPGIHISGDVAKDVIRGLNAIQIGASKAKSGTALTGPVKLTAGAKHTFNPSDCLHGSNSKLTHSKVPFTALSISSAMPLESQPSKIYQL